MISEPTSAKAFSTNSTNVRFVGHRKGMIMKTQSIDIHDRHSAVTANITSTLIKRRTFTRLLLVVLTGLLTWGLYMLAHLAGAPVDIFAALSATSALAYLGLATQSRTGLQLSLNLIAAPAIFSCAYLGFAVAAVWLIVSFALHGVVAAAQTGSVDRDIQAVLSPWTTFNGVMVALLWMG